MAKNVAVFGIYRSRQNVEEAVQALKNADFRSTCVFRSIATAIPI